MNRAETHNNIETERLILRPLTIEDAEFILEFYNMPKFIEFIGDRNIRTIADAEAYITAKFLPQFERLGFGNYLVIRKSDHRKVGAAGIFERDGLDVYDIGFSFLTAFERNGYGFESASKIIETAFTKFGLQKISAITTVANISSQKLIEKLGLKYIKMIRLPDDDENLKYYEIEKDSSLQ